MVTLTTLQLHADLSNYAWGTWFRGAEWKPPFLYVPFGDDSHRAFIEKHYVSRFKEIVPAFELRHLLKPAPVKAGTKYPALKSTGAARQWRDLLDSQDS
jgi:hypothetical protein